MNRGVEPTRRNARFSARAESFPAVNQASSGFSEADSIGLGRIAVQVAALASEHGGQLGRMGIGPTELHWPASSRAHPFPMVQSIV